MPHRSPNNGPFLARGATALRSIVGYIA
jgi:hypothetical protein